MSKSAPKVKHTPLSKTAKFWETPTEQDTPQAHEEPKTQEELLKQILQRLDVMIEKMDKLL
jgi:hypothetical protein